MTNNFVDYAFRASDVPTMCPGVVLPCERTLPNRLIDVKNVKDFGAVGDGMTDDLGAIMDAFNSLTGTNRSTIFFPPGTYYVSAPIDISGDPGTDIVVELLGVLGASTITGSFADYVIKKQNTTAVGNQSYISKLTVINNDAAGGGIRWGSCVGASIRDCTVVANLGINTSQDDSGSAGATPIGYSIENCDVSPGSNTSGSIGLMIVTNGPVFNCRVIGYEIGVVLWGQEGSQYFSGCYFEGNGIAAKPGQRPDGVASGDGGYSFVGCHFKNNGTALYIANGGAQITGCHIEADESVMVYGARPQYGIRILDQTGFYAGIVVDGQYDQYAISLDTAVNFNGGPLAQFFGVNAFNTSTHGGVAWLPPTNAQTATFHACNCPAPVYTVVNLPVQIRTYTVSTATWSSGTATITVVGGPGDLPNSGTFNVVISGVSPSGYNGTFTADAGNFFTFTYPLASDPMGSGSAGSALASLGFAQEGDSYNVSDSNTSTWAAAAGGGGSTRALVRWSGSNWNVVGK